jgi:carbamoyltransferase
MYVLGIGTSHDSGAVLLKDGEVVCCIEEERLTRVKHTNARALRSVFACLAYEGITLADLELCAVSYAEERIDDHSRQNPFWASPEAPIVSAREELHGQLAAFGFARGPENIRFVEHHLAHVATAFECSGFESALVATLDGQGDDVSSIIATADPGGYGVLRREDPASSIGLLYTNVTVLLGFRVFDEYKVMGLAPYGDPATYRPLFEASYELQADGRYSLDLAGLKTRLLTAGLLRQHGAALEQRHKDSAASLQEALEAIVFHTMKHWRQETGRSQLCLAGGVALNCTMNGKLRRSGLFDSLFVQPASSDCGLSLGAAQYAYAESRRRGNTVSRRERLRSVYWGRSIDAERSVESVLERWGAFVEWEHCSDVASRAAERLAAGAIAGWAQGRSEFGPRALGNRSILADPRPKENRDRVNSAIKKREGFRPFAPSVLEEVAHEFFEIEAGESFPFMLFVYPVRAEHRDELGAITHIDGTARLHTVAKDVNPLYHRLIARFGELTGVPIVLNTSFNNSAEPIVDSVEDAVVTFLTTDLDDLFVGDFHVRKRADFESRIPELIPELISAVEVRCSAAHGKVDYWLERLEVVEFEETSLPVSPALYEVLLRLVEGKDGKRTLREIQERYGAGSEESLVEALQRLWWRRCVRMDPSATRPAHE